MLGRLLRNSTPLAAALLIVGRPASLLAEAIESSIRSARLRRVGCIFQRGFIRSAAERADSNGGRSLVGPRLPDERLVQPTLDGDSRSPLMWNQGDLARDHFSGFGHHHDRDAASRGGHGAARRGHSTVGNPNELRDMEDLLEHGPGEANPALSLEHEGVGHPE